MDKIDAPQIIILAWLALHLVVSVRDHGKPRPPYDRSDAFWTVVLWFSLLYWGGFFTTGAA